MKKVYLAFSDANDNSIISMSPARRARYEEITEPSVKRQYLASSRAVAASAAAVTGNIDSALTFRYAENGAPEVDGAYISPAHTEGMAACAAADVPVGLDIEPRGRYLSEAMLRKIGPLDNFLALEACVKMTGEGLARGRNRYHISGNIIVDADGIFVANVRFIDHGNFRICVCCSEEFEIKML